MSRIIDRDRFDAILFDLDGVITDTARIHSAAWKRMFDGYLRSRRGERFVPFERADYLEHVDGKPRYDGVRSFLASRNIVIPEGDPSDPPDRETVCGLGNRKDQLFNQVLAEEGVDTYDGSIAFLEQARRSGMRTAVVSSSKNCLGVITAAGIEDQFDVRVDGTVCAQLGLPGKPAPDAFLEAARRLGVDPARGVVVEDAIAGVEAGRAGGFGLVVGVDRHQMADELRAAGADLVVEDLAELL